MAGLINTAMTGVKSNPIPENNTFLSAEPVGYDPALGKVNEKTDTVAGQMTGLLSSDSPYLNLARTGAKLEANRRGLLNSSMAAGAGEAAAISAALPIASQDASTFSTQRLNNQNTKNAAFQFGANATNTANLTNAAAGNEFGKIKAGTEAEKELIGTRAGAEAGLQEQRGQIESALSAQSSAQAQALAQVQGEIESGLITTREQANARLAELQAQLESGLIGTRAAAESQLQQERITGEKQLQAQRGQLDRALQELRGSQELALQGLRGEQAQVIANVEGTYRELLQTSASATSVYNGIVRNISDIMGNIDLDAESKQIAIDNNIAMLESGLAILGGISGLDLASLLTFGG